MMNNNKTAPSLASHNYIPLGIFTPSQDTERRNHDDDDDRTHSTTRDGLDNPRLGHAVSQEYVVDGRMAVHRGDEEPLLGGNDPREEEEREEVGSNTITSSLPTRTTHDNLPFESRGCFDSLLLGNMRGWSALLVQIFSVTFVALVWAMVLKKMSISHLPLFAYHPLIQSLSLVVFAQSILVLQPTTQGTPKRKTQALLWHQLINLFIALPLFTAGAYIMWYMHSKPRQTHFQSWHGTLGFIVVIWSWFQALVGAGSVWFKGKAFGGESRAKAVWKWHRLSGYLLLPLYLTVLLLGAVETKWASGIATTGHQIAIGLSLLGVIIAASLRVQTSKLPKPTSTSSGRISNSRSGRSASR